MFLACDIVVDLIIDEVNEKVVQLLESSHLVLAEGLQVLFQLIKVEILILRVQR